MVKYNYIFYNYSVKWSMKMILENRRFKLFILFSCFYYLSRLYRMYKTIVI